MSFDWQDRNESTVTPVEGKLPVSVVLVVIKSRMEFVKNFVIPSIEANNPAEIFIVDDDDLTNQEKRNKGAFLSNQKYIFVCDDDVVMPKGHLSILCQVLEENPKIAFAYNDYQAIVMDPSSHPKGGNYYQRCREFDIETLKFNNYIDTCSLVRRDVFPGFDPNIKRFQDWDLWLTISLKGNIGKYVENTGIIKYYLDEGITSNKSNVEECREIILRKHSLSGLLSILFVDTGEGFNPSQSIPKELVVNNNKFEVEFDLSDYKDIKRLRFDPVESKCCQVNNMELSFSENNQPTKWKYSITSNALQEKDDSFLFDTLDPQFHISVEQSIDFLKVRGSIFFDPVFLPEQEPSLSLGRKIKRFFS